MYSPLAIHCASLCFDIIQSSNFETLGHEDIDNFKEDIYGLILDRTNLNSSIHRREHFFVLDVTNGVISILHQCLNSRCARDSVWILSTLESRIDTSIKMVLH